jgi:hypothetical protein
VLECRWAYDPSSRFPSIVPTFHTKAGAVIDLYDPYDPSKPDHLGVLRYIYPKAQLSALLTGSRFNVRELEHYWGEGFYLLVGEGGT